MNDKTDFNVLKERLEAQTEAYATLAQSLAVIVELTKELKDKIKDQGSVSSTALNEVAKTITVMSAQLESYANIARNNDTMMVHHLADYNSIGQQSLLEIRKHQENVVKLNDTLEDLRDLDQQQHSELVNIFKKISKDIHFLISAHNDTASQIQLIYNNRVSWIDRIKHSKYYILAVLSIIGILEMLVQFGILKFIWGGQ